MCIRHDLLRSVMCNKDLIELNLKTTAFEKPHRMNLRKLFKL